MVLGIHYNQLRIIERERIMLYRSHGFSVREIGLELGRSPITVSRDLRRNAVSFGSGFYMAHDADWRARRRKRFAGKRFCLKSSELRCAVEEKLRFRCVVSGVDIGSSSIGWGSFSESRVDLSVYLY